MWIFGWSHMLLVFSLSFHLHLQSSGKISSLSFYFEKHFRKSLLSVSYASWLNASLNDHILENAK